MSNSFLPNSEFFLSPDLNLVILLISKPNKFPHTSYNIKVDFAL